MDDATTAIAYLWDDAENYWPAAEGDDDRTDPFSPGLGLGHFQAAHARLDALGVRVPAIRLVDRDGVHCPAELVIVEDLPGRDWRSCSRVTRARLLRSWPGPRSRWRRYGVTGHRCTARWPWSMQEARRTVCRARGWFSTARCGTSPRRPRAIRGSRARGTGWRSGCWDKGLRVALERLAVLNERISAQTEARDRLEPALRQATGGRIRPVV
ncbi:hypothetical protein [Streptomyces canus]|uniref:hypothetical protein n=1 Tax=Streptomyces canus TaxID=58343 RepID=UPI002784C1B5|nr:hypothetical protein [Streptomyces canus]